MRGIRGLTGVYGLSVGVSSSKTPDEVTGLWAWWKADAGITKDGDNLVSQWDDQSGNGKHLTQGTADNKPAWQEGVRSGILPALQFDGVDDYLTLADVPATGTDGRCLMAAIRNATTSGTGYNHLIHYGNTSNGVAYGITTRSYVAHTGAGKDGPGNHYWGSGLAGTADITGDDVLVVYFDGTNDVIRHNRIQTATGTPTINTANAAFRVGARVGLGGEWFTGMVCEVVAYSTCPSLADIIAVESYLYNRWIS